MRILDRKRKMYWMLKDGASYEDVASTFGVSVETVKKAEARYTPFERKDRVTRSLKEKRELMKQYYILKKADKKLSVLTASKKLGVEYMELQLMISTIYKTLEPQFREEFEKQQKK